MEKIITVLSFTVLFIALATWRLWRLPILSSQRDMHRFFGEVIEIKKLRAGITEITLKRGIPSGTLSEEGGGRSSVYEIAGRFYARKKSVLPRLGQYIEVKTDLLHYYLAGRTIDWLDSWKPIPFSTSTTSTVDDRGWGKRRLTIS